MKPIAVQLYSLREEAEKDFVGVLKRVAEMGYAGVEPAGFYGLEAGELRSIVEDLGMQLSSSHGPWASPDNLSEVVDTVGTLGLDTACCGYGPADFADRDAIKATAERVTGMAEALAAQGITLFMHNHWWEFQRVDGRIAYEIFAELCPQARFEIDTYWAANFGANDPAEQVRAFKDRALYLHVKDGPLEKDEPHVALGQGRMDIPPVIGAADDAVLRWLVVELDSCATDMFTAVRESYEYLVANDLGYGREGMK